MQVQHPTKNSRNFKKDIIVLSAVFAGFVLLTMLQDFLETNFQRSSFYFSESFMFSSFWWIFIPFLYVQYSLARRKNFNKPVLVILLMLVPAIIHLFAFPALVYLMSDTFYYYSFRFRQTLQYEMSEHLYTLAFFYTIPLGLYLHIKKTQQSKQQVIKTLSAAANTNTTPVNAFIVADGSKRISIAITDILYLTASSPYIHIHHRSKKYLSSETLKSATEKLAGANFIRIHKSTIVNMQQVQSYTSRLNGDYDLCMNDGMGLRVSRNYAAAFKTAFQQTHQLATK